MASGKGKGNPSQGKVEDDVDALFRLPLAEFTSARNSLAARLKKDGQGNEAIRVKALVKPSITAWAVNQLYWMHREAFDRLIATSQRFRQAQSSLLAGKAADMRGPLEARHEALSELSLHATGLLREAGSNPTPDTIRRITATLEAMSAYASFPDDLAPGRLNHDVDPPGFEALGSFVPGAAIPKRKEEPARVIPFRKGTAVTTPRQKEVPSRVVRQPSRVVRQPSREVRRIEETRQAKKAAAKASLQDARRVLVQARVELQRAEAAHKKANADAKAKEKQRREAETRFEKATAASADATRRAEGVAAEVEEAAHALQDAERTVEQASKKLESLS